MTDALQTRLNRLVKPTPLYVRTLRQMLSPSSSSLRGADLAPSGGRHAARGSQPPMSLDLLERADDEVSTIGLILTYLRVAHSIQTPPLDCFYRVRREVRGLSTKPHSLEKFTYLCRWLQDHSSEVAALAEQDSYLYDLIDAGEQLRISTTIILQGVEDKWITIGEAAKIAGCKTDTIERWGWNGIIETTPRDTSHQVLYSEGSVRTAVVLRQHRQEYRRRRLLQSSPSSRNTGDTNNTRGQ